MASINDRAFPSISALRIWFLHSKTTKRRNLHLFIPRNFFKRFETCLNDSSMTSSCYKKGARAQNNSFLVTWIYRKKKTFQWKMRVTSFVISPKNVKFNENRYEHFWLEGKIPYNRNHSSFTWKADKITNVEFYSIRNS